MRRGQLPNYFSRGDSRVLAALHLGEQNDKLVAAQSAYRVRPPDGVHQSPSHRLQQLVAHRVTQRVIYFLEMIQIEIHHGELLALAYRQRNRLREPVIEQDAVWQTG